ncbi:hypothetical protein GRI62_08685 [Erythrobacter arachoides]|uniref:DUF6644 domain-containing protein n=1 Tax=Aurantiacibacter arachoides TaxID=1850444 RepID=A0A844ZZH4_9SPHN|nr:DUF6644 family protein [Aurantiacibacter arachoides]MXO93681.1 hypothetical protein [Aurantiacibacter arachoides]GGD47463.1 membrane protein [Aurantiacibacter arachoides]
MASYYPEPTNIWESIEYSSLGTSIAESLWAFPTLETIHVIALVTVIGTIAVMDLRLLGIASNETAVTRMSSDTLPWTWGAFVLAAITGTLLFISKASSYMANPYFIMKMGLLVLAALNMLYFHFVTYKTVHDWDTGLHLPTGAKVAATLSLVFWIGVVFAGRAIGFTLGIFY